MYCYYKCSVALPWVGLQYVIVVFPDHTHLLFILNGVTGHNFYEMVYFGFLKIVFILPIIVVPDEMLLY